MKILIIGKDLEAKKLLDLYKNTKVKIITEEEANIHNIDLPRNEVIDTKLKIENFIDLKEVEKYKIEKSKIYKRKKNKPWNRKKLSHY